VSTLLRALAAGLLCVLALWLAGCAQPMPAPATDTTTPSYWRGRLALRVETPEPTSFFAGFELSGQARAGELLLSSPLGTTLAQLRWSPAYALLRNNGETRAFDSLDALATEATGTDIPIAALFQWLQGQPATAHGWQADLSQLGEGRLVARRVEPAPAAELRLILEQP
jgi:outer membrane lipoprotein LolB